MHSQLLKRIIVHISCVFEFGGLALKMLYMLEYSVCMIWNRKAGSYISSLEALELPLFQRP